MGILYPLNHCMAAGALKGAEHGRSGEVERSVRWLVDHGGCGR